MNEKFVSKELGIAIRLFDFLSDRCDVNSSFRPAKWSPVARRLFCQAVVGNAPGPEIRQPGAAELVDLAWLYCLRRFAPAGMFWATTAGAVWSYRIAVWAARIAGIHKNSHATRLELEFEDAPREPVLWVDVSNSFSGAPVAGIQRVCRELLIRLQRPDRIVAIGAGIGSRRFERLVLAASGFGGAGDPGTMRFGRGDVYFDIDSNWSRPFDRIDLYKQLKRAGVTIWTMHYDAVPVLLPKYSHPNTVFRFLQSLTALLAYADRCFCTAVSVREELDLLGRIAGQPAPAGQVLTLGANHETELGTDGQAAGAVRAFALKRPFVLCVGTVEPRKNLAAVLSLVPMLKDLGVGLVVVGRKGWESESLIGQLDRLSADDAFVLWRRQVGDSTLNWLYRNCFLYIAPSWHEGFGLPLSEALREGAPCLVSNRGALGATAAGCAMLFSPDDESALPALVRKAIVDPSFHQRLRGMAADYKTPSWESCAAMLEAEFLRFARRA